MPIILTADQIAKVKRVDTAAAFLTKEILIVETYDPMKEEHLEFEVNRDVLKALIPNKDANSKTKIVLNQEDLKALIVEDLDIIAHQVLGYCKKAKDKGLAKEFQFSQSTIDGLNQPEVLPFVTRIVGLITPLLTNAIFMKYKVTALELTALTDLAETYDENIGKKGTTVNELITTNVDINKTLKLLIDNLHQMGTLNYYFKKRNRAFYDGLIKNCRAQYAPNRATGVEGTVFGKDNKPLANCLVKIEGTDFTTITDSKGHYIIVGLTVGDYNMLAANEGGDSETLPIHVHYRHIETYDFHLGI